VGSVFIFGFFLLVFVFILKKLFKKAKDGDDNYYVSVLIFSFLGMLLVNSMAEVTILFITRFAMFMFWMFLGYCLSLVSNGEKSKGTEFLEGLSDKVNNIFKKNK
jgi:asparagine N-glycosylation enzyme membrane subunit Stt3